MVDGHGSAPTNGAPPPWMEMHWVDVAATNWSIFLSRIS
jgi:hypothetical protein